MEGRGEREAKNKGKNLKLQLWGLWKAHAEKDKEMKKTLNTTKTDKPIWFRARSYGWGWTPNTWEGWVLTLGFIAVIVGGSALYEAMPSTPLARIFIPFMILFTIIFVSICYFTGEKPEWKWAGKPIFKKK